jgi:DNA-binding beta-propeller fold protein YncE
MVTNIHPGSIRVMVLRSLLKVRSLVLILGLILALTVSSFTTVIEVDYIGDIDDGLFSPASLAVSGGQLAVLEPFSRQLKVYTADGVRVELVDLDGLGSGLARLTDSRYLYCDRNRKTVSLVDVGNHAIEEFGSSTSGLLDPIDIVVKGQIVYVLDAENASILEMDESGQLHAEFRLVDSAGIEIPYASSFCLHNTGMRFYVVNQIDSEIWMFSVDGSYYGRFGSFGNRDGEITRAGEILCDSDGLIYVTDRYQNRVVVYDESGDFIGNIDLYGSQDALMATPTGIAIEGDGILYVASTEAASVQIFAVTKSASQTAAFQASQLMPIYGDTLDARNVVLVAQVTVHDSQISDFALEFGLYDAGDHSSPIQTALVSDGVQTQGNDPSAMVAEWRPDVRLQENSEYDWRVRALSEDATGEWTPFRRFLTHALPGSFRLEQNYPNPFNPETRISFSVPRAMRVRLEVINILGQSVTVLVDREMDAGRHDISWYGNNDDGSPAPSGIYFYRLAAEDYMVTKKMVLLR